MTNITTRTTVTMSVERSNPKSGERAPDDFPLI